MLFELLCQKVGIELGLEMLLHSTFFDVLFQFLLDIFMIFSDVAFFEVSQWSSFKLSSAVLE